MPYTYKKQGGKYVVYKKENGEKVGSTNGTEVALKKYLAALHMHADENIKTKMKNIKTFEQFINENIDNHINESSIVISTKELDKLFKPTTNGEDLANEEEIENQLEKLGVIKEVETTNNGDKVTFLFKGGEIRIDFKHKTIEIGK